MSISRRRFVRTATLSALAGAALRSAWAKPGAAAADETFSPENLVALNGISMQTFERLAGESFTVSSGDRTLGTAVLNCANLRAKNSKPDAKNCTFYATDSIEKFECLGSAFLGLPVTGVRHVDLGG